MQVRDGRATVPRGDNVVLNRLREGGPAVSAELDRKVSTHDREYVGKFDVNRSSTGGSKHRGRTTAVYYLYGDERRAVRRYIEENTEFVEGCIADQANPINLNREDYWWRMFQEEWYWGGYDEAGP